MTKKKESKKEPKKEVLALIMGLTIGLIIGVGSTYMFMKHQEESKQEQFEQEKLTITEKLGLEITKLGLRNSTYTYVDKIQAKIAENNEKESTEEEKVVKITKGMYVLDKDGIFNQVDEKTAEIIKDGIKIEGIEFGEKQPLEKSVISVNEKGKISDAIFYVDEFQIKYDLIGTTVTKLGEKEDNNE